MEERTLNFLDTWIDANITSASHEPDGDASTMQYRFLTDAVAAGLALEDVNAEWREAEIKTKSVGGSPLQEVSSTTNILGFFLGRSCVQRQRGRLLCRPRVQEA
jgi:hypothetical protein